MGTVGNGTMDGVFAVEQGRVEAINDEGVAMSEVHDHHHGGSDNPGGHDPSVPEEAPSEGSGNPGPNLGHEDEQSHFQSAGSPGPDLPGEPEVQGEGSSNPGPEL